MATINIDGKRSRKFGVPVHNPRQLAEMAQSDSAVKKDKLKRPQKFISATLRIIPQNKITQTGTTNGSSPSTTNFFSIKRLLARNLIEAPKKKLLTTLFQIKSKLYLLIRRYSKLYEAKGRDQSA